MHDSLEMLGLCSGQLSLPVLVAHSAEQLLHASHTLGDYDVDKGSSIALAGA